MRVLADTHALVWAFAEPAKLSPRAKTAIDGGVVASVATLLELCLKARKRGALLEDPVGWWQDMIRLGEVDTLPIQEQHVVRMASLEPLHKDPFDRILVAQALVESLPLVSRDRTLSEYGVQTIW